MVVLNLVDNLKISFDIPRALWKSILSHPTSIFRSNEFNPKEGILQGNTEDSINRLKRIHKTLYDVNIIKELDDIDKQLLLNSVHDISKDPETKQTETTIKKAKGN